MSGWWTPIWTVGSGPNRLYCGIARTEDGFAVDVFRGDTCIDSVEYATRKEAVREAAAFERQYVLQPARSQARRPTHIDDVVAHG